jgi:phosphomannomutase
MLTGSHNPANYNGLKIVLAGETLSGDSIQKLKERINSNNLFQSFTTQRPTYVVNNIIGKCLINDTPNIISAENNIARAGKL